MRTLLWRVVAVAIAINGLPRVALYAQTKSEPPRGNLQGVGAEPFAPEQQASKGSVTVAESLINYDAFAGTLVVHPKDWDDVPQNTRTRTTRTSRPKRACSTSRTSNPTTRTQQRPVTFLYNGGPGSSTVWLHMGAFGPKRVVTADDTHTPAAPYRSSTTSTACST